MLRCRKCRKVLIECLQEVEFPDESSKTACNIWHMDVDTLPEWILTSLHLAQWTAGRLNCRNCGSRLGGFNFIHRNECPCGRDATVHFGKCRVDLDHKQNHLTGQPRWSRPDTRPLLTESSQDKYKRPKLSINDSLQLNIVADVHLLDRDEASQITPKEDSTYRSTVCPVMYPIDQDVETTICAFIGCSSVSVARPVPPERQMVESEEDEQSSAENAQEEISPSLRGTPISYNTVEQEEDIMPGSLLASTALHRQRKREKNHLKSQRRKQRRREKWLLNQASILSDLMLNGDKEEKGDRQGLTCAVCLDVYFHPYSCQPCSHVFCEPCLRRLAKNREENTPCPLCRAIISHTKFLTELNRKVEDSFPRVYRTREQHFKNGSCVKWPLPSCRKPFRSLWGYRRYAGRAHRSWHFAHVGFAPQTLNISDICGCFFDLGLAIVNNYSAKWVLALLVLFMSLYYLCI